MIKEFDENKTYVFSKERYVENAKVVTESNEREWYDRIDGVEVEIESANTGKCWDMVVIPDWCEENYNPVVEIKINQKEKNILIKALEYLDNNNYFIEEESRLVEKLLKKINNY